MLGKSRPGINPEWIYFLNKAHTIFGWIYILLVKVPILTGWYGKSETGYYMFYIILAVSVPSYLLYLYLKFFRSKIQGISVSQADIKSDLRMIKSSKDLSIYSDNFFIFANYVYSTNPILGIHPGGWKIIQEVQGREVDRFLYGVDPIQLFDVTKVSHTAKSIELAGEPIARLNIPTTYSKMQKLNNAKFVSVSCHDELDRIHTVHFSFRNQVCFGGYSNLSQIGQYFSVTVDKKLTRLYTAVNFLQHKNVNLMIKISKGGIKVSNKHINLWKNMKQDKTEEITVRQELVETNFQSRNNTLPLLIKKYHKGKFTSQFLDFSHQTHLTKQILISQPRGLGLSLDVCPSPNIILFAGGTGLYPYCDFIDLLFKSMLVSQNHENTTSILETDPILKLNPFQNINVSLYLAVNQLSELHPITLYQCNQLSRTKIFKAFAKIKKANAESFSAQYGNINIHEGRFEGIVNKKLSDNQDSCFFICGPVRFTKGLVDQLRRLHVGADRYRIV